MVSRFLGGEGSGRECRKPPSLGASVTVQEALVGDWSATAAGVFDRGGDRRFLYRNPSCLCSLRSFPFLILLRFRRRRVGSLCFLTHPLRVSVGKTRESFLALKCELRPCLCAWLRCPPPSRGLLGLSIRRCACIAASGSRQP